MAGDRQLVREAIAAYFGGSLETTDAGKYYQGGPLASQGLGSAWPFPPKGVPDTLFTQGVPDGFAWGAVLYVQSPERLTTRRPDGAMGGPTSGWRGRHYTITCELMAISYEPHVETAEAGFDDLLDALEGLIYADRTLGTTSSAYPTGRLITQAGEGPEGIRTSPEPFAPLTTDERGKYGGYGTLTFQALTMVQA
jgi:hypothetical protein